MSDAMIRIYARLVQKGRRSLDEIPEPDRTKVKAVVDLLNGESSKE